MAGKLILIPTPIGNLEDMTFRAVRVLKEEVKHVLAEDTRTSGKLFLHYGIKVPMRAYHQHNEHKVVEALAQEIAGGKIVGLITDAGTPGISDPGYLLVRECLKQGAQVECLPGATAFVPALVKSGLPSHSFAFEGFLPQKKGRKKRLEQLKDEERTLIFYESPYRVVKFLEEIVSIFGSGRQISVSRELSKMFEETVNGTAEEALVHFNNKPPKGEFVIVVEGANPTKKALETKQ